MKTALIVSTFEQPLSLGKVLRGISLQTEKPGEVYIADDGSGVATKELIDSWRADVQFPVYHLWHAHEGFRKVILLNKAVAAATADYLLFLDGDCVPHPQYLRDHQRLAEREFWVQGRRCYVREPFVPKFEPGKTRVWQWVLARRVIGAAKAIRLPFPIVFRNREQRGIIGCNMAFWRDDIIAVNGFDETYLGRGIGPDSDLGTRVYNLGHPRKFVYGHAIVYHLDHFVAPRDNLAEKKSRLQETIASGRTRCEKGLDQYLHHANS
jgi:glycosyltransferase involved in cell wall biosynthesis